MCNIHYKYEHWSCPLFVKWKVNAEWFSNLESQIMSAWWWRCSNVRFGLLFPFQLAPMDTCASLERWEWCLFSPTWEKNRIDGNPRVETNKTVQSMTGVFGVQPLSVLFQCGRPVQTSYCPECKVQIGGIKHMAVAGFSETHRSESEASSLVCKSSHYIRLCVCSLLVGMSASAA